MEFNQSLIHQFNTSSSVCLSVLVTLIALGVLAIMMPWLMAWLGFAEEGIVEGKLDAGSYAEQRH
jgi:hypothetical protein